MQWAWPTPLDSALGADARRAARSIVDTMDKPCNAADAPSHGSVGPPRYNGCARAKGLANPSGPGRFPLMRRCRLLIGSLPNLVGSATPFGEICRGRGDGGYSDRLLPIVPIVSRQGEACSGRLGL